MHETVLEVIRPHAPDLLRTQCLPSTLLALVSMLCLGATLRRELVCAQFGVLPSRSNGLLQRVTLLVLVCELPGILTMALGILVAQDEVGLALAEVLALELLGLLLPLNRVDLAARELVLVARERPRVRLHPAGQLVVSRSEVFGVRAAALELGVLRVLLVVL